jgi:hypothetical protein
MQRLCGDDRLRGSIDDHRDGHGTNDRSDAESEA